MNGSPKLISFFHITNSLWSSAANTIKASLSHLSLPTTSASVTGSDYDSTIYCISTSKTTKEVLIFQAKGTWESTKSISAQLRSEERDTWQRRGLSPAWCLLPLKRDGSTSKELPGCSLTGVSVIILTQDPACCLSHLTEKWTITGKI